MCDIKLSRTKGHKCTNICPLKYSLLNMTTYIEQLQKQ